MSETKKYTPADLPSSFGEGFQPEVEDMFRVVTLKAMLTQTTTERDELAGLLLELQSEYTFRSEQAERIEALLRKAGVL